ncbi:MAG: diphthine--ammonia ligase [Bacteroidia bacterium]
MEKKEKVVFCWSGGKDSALALYKIQQENKYEVIAFLTTVNENFKRVSMHGVREELLEMQADSVGIPLEKIYVNQGSNAEYENKMEEFLLRYKKKGVEKIIFGDIFLEDLRTYRDANLAKVNMQGIYPLWKKNTKELITEFLSLGFQTIICCANDAFLNEQHVGEIITQKFITDLPDNVDPCGENGEFHTFCFAGPIFKKKINFSIAEKIYRPLEIKKSEDNCSLLESKTLGFWFCDLKK